MEKKVYMMPLIEVEKINLSIAVLAGSPDDSSPMPDPSHPGAPKRRVAPVF
jgi:hypothetical protein